MSMSRRNRFPQLLSCLLLFSRAPALQPWAHLPAKLTPAFAQVLKWGIPVSVTAGSLHSVTGATGVAPVSPSENPAVATVGDSFTWVFRTTGEKAKSYSVDGLPPGIDYSGVVTNAVSSIAGAPTQPGTYEVSIIGWRREDERGDKTPTYTLTIHVEDGTPPQIISHPESGTFDEGEAAALHVAAEGGALQYRWFKDGQEILPVSATFIDSETPIKALIPQSDQGAAWRNDHEFDDVEWINGSAGAGYEASAANTYDPFFQVDLSAMQGQQTSAYLRIPFENTLTDWQRFNYLTLRVRYDDGFIAFLNGQEIASANAPLNPTWNAQATGSHEDDLAVDFVTFDCSAFLEHLAPGANLLAVHGLNASKGSSDFLIDVALEAGLDVNRPTLPLGELTPSQSGSYMVEVFNGAGVTPSEAAEVVVIPNQVSSFHQWQLAHWSGDLLDDALIAGPHADPDHDGLSNLEEHVLGLDPAQPTQQEIFTTETVDREDGKFLEITLPKAPDSDAAVMVELSASLETPDWHVSDQVELEVLPTEIVARVPLTEIASFLRFRFTLPN